MGEVCTQRFQQFDLGVANIDEDDGDAMFWQSLRLCQFCPKRIAINHGGCLQVRHGDRDMIETSEHGRFLMGGSRKP